jgi:hypothetical protein
MTKNDQQWTEENMSHFYTPTNHRNHSEPENSCWSHSALDLWSNSSSNEEKYNQHRSNNQRIVSVTSLGKSLFQLFLSTVFGVRLWHFIGLIWNNTWIPSQTIFDSINSFNDQQIRLTISSIEQYLMDWFLLTTRNHCHAWFINIVHASPPGLSRRWVTSSIIGKGWRIQSIWPRWLLGIQEEFGLGSLNQSLTWVGLSYCESRVEFEARDSFPRYVMNDHCHSSPLTSIHQEVVCQLPFGLSLGSTMPVEDAEREKTHYLTDCARVHSVWYQKSVTIYKVGLTDHTIKIEWFQREGLLLMMFQRQWRQFEAFV